MLRKILIAGMVLGLANPSFAHDWYTNERTSPDHPVYPGWSCCNGDAVSGDCKPVRAWTTPAGSWQFEYNGATWDVPDYAIRPDETNGEPFQASACVYKGQVMCFWRKAAGG
jgi:hypothetical protein